MQILFAIFLQKSTTFLFFLYISSFTSYPTDGSHQKYAEENGKNTQKCRDKQYLTRELIVALHILCHYVTADSRRSSEDDERDKQLVSSEAEEIRRRNSEYRVNNRLDNRGYRCKGDIALQSFERESRTEAYQRKSGRRIGKVIHRRAYYRGELNAEKHKGKSEKNGDYERILDRIQKYLSFSLLRLLL